MQPPLRLVLIACSQQKLDRPSPAKLLYVGALFKKSVAIVTRAQLPWAILSAKHGLLQPDDIIAPYDQPLHSLTRRQRMMWAAQTNQQIHALYPATHVIALCGEHYRTSLAGFDVRIPLFGLPIGEQLHRLSDPTYTL